MRITVFGATGGTGRQVVERALALGHDVVAVARRPEAVTPASRLTVHAGDVLDPASVARAVDGSDAVIICIGPTKNFSPGTIVSEGLSNIIAGCRRAGVERIVFQSGILMSDGAELSTPNRLAIRVLRRIYAKACADKAIAERALRQSDLDWVIVRASGLRHAPATLKYSAGPGARISPLLALPYADCADCLVRATSEPTWARHIINVGR
jgi:uncharacterized protein YbjT (DUF2867 family)